MKTTVKHLAAGTFIALLLLVGNVNAKGTEAKALSRETETTLQVEKWMTDDVLWNPRSISITEISQETETSLELENWMTSSEAWDFGHNFVEKTEESIEIEYWMTREKYWKVNNNIKVTESELAIEKQVLNNHDWNR